MYIYIYTLDGPLSCLNTKAFKVQQVSRTVIPRYGQTFKDVFRDLAPELVLCPGLATHTRVIQWIGVRKTSKVNDEFYMLFHQFEKGVLWVSLQRSHPW